MFNKKGAVLMQVLLVSLVIAMIATFILRLSYLRTKTVMRSKTFITVKQAVDACRFEVESAIDTFTFNNPTKQYCQLNDLCENTLFMTCPLDTCEFECTALADGVPAVTAVIEPVEDQNYRKITYTLDSSWELPYQ